MKMIRSHSAGVFVGDIESEDGQTVVVTNCRWIWMWKGAATISELAQKGTTKPEECKFPAPVDRVKLFQVVQILDVTPEAEASLNSVKIWTEF